MSPQVAARLRDAPLTYPEIGATAGELPGGYRHVRRSALLGSGQRVFGDAANALMSWQVHLRAGFDVAASDPIAAADTVVLLRERTMFLRLVRAPCRVVYVIDQPHQRGFAYGTLAGHPESGEEAFVVSQDEGGAVTLAVTAFSRPATLLSRIAGPVGSLVQDVITDRYLRALGGSL
jgi:uncharacterized protein (UPF0548 family)